MIKDFMTNLSRITLYILLLVPVSETTAQQIISAADDVYGSDPLLYNGRYYTEFYPLNTIDNQYLTSRQFESGTVTLRGVTYSDLLLNYDIFNQQLLLKYRSNPSFKPVIIVSDAWLETFSVKDKKFRIYPISDEEKRIYQEIGSGQIRILYFWKKYSHLENTIGGPKMTFTNPVREMNLFTDGKIIKYWNNRSFIDLFSPEKKEVIKEYLHGHRINVKKASDKIMEELINFCNTLARK
jgi:hypothetical protein